ncbi:MAG TPA: hypothetical protein VIS52_06140 [Motiliproteus sp.]
MLKPSTIILATALYMLFLFVVAQLVEKYHEGKTRSPSSPLIYALSITIYCTSWTYYGSVGFAAQSGMLYTAIYIGAIVAILFWWRYLRGMVQLKENYHISSIADFISARYNRSQRVAALVTLISLLGILPYIALQLKAVIDTFALLANQPPDEAWGATGILITVVMVLFTILFGARRLDPTERHPGMMVALAIQSLVKLVAFLAVGLFVTYGLFDGLGDITQRIHWAGLTHLIGSRIPEGSLFMHWATLIILGAASIQCLPRQFHVAVVENANERHILTAAWLVPLYLVAIGFFVIPIAAAGLLKGLDYNQADSFVLLLPQMAGEKELTLLVFLGGFSAAASMVIVSAMTLSTMATNHLLLPCIEALRMGNTLRHYLLPCRWVMITLLLGGAYLVGREFSDSYMLVAMGMIAFVAVFQFVPAMFLGMVWRRGNRVGAIAALSTGLVLWFYTLVVPVMAQNGWLSASLLSDGPWGITLLRPEALLGLEGLSSVSHSLVWTLVFNLGAYLIGSLLYQPSKLERTQLTEFIEVLVRGGRRARGTATGLDAYVSMNEKRREAQRLLGEYLPDDKAAIEVEEICTDLRLGHKEFLTIIELLEFHRRLEHVLAGAIGAASAHQAIEKAINYSEREQRDLREIYSHIMVELKSQQQKESGKQPTESNQLGLIAQLQQRIDELERELEAQSQQVERLTERLSRTDEKLFKQRLHNQQLTQELHKLQPQQDDPAPPPGG